MRLETIDGARVILGIPLSRLREGMRRASDEAKPLHVRAITLPSIMRGYVDFCELDHPNFGRGVSASIIDEAFFTQEGDVVVGLTKPF